MPKVKRENRIVGKYTDTTTKQFAEYSILIKIKLVLNNFFVLYFLVYIYSSFPNVILLQIYFSLSPPNKLIVICS
jgi:hypothetical protein